MVTNISINENATQVLAGRMRSLPLVAAEIIIQIIGVSFADCVARKPEFLAAKPLKATLSSARE